MWELIRSDKVGKLIVLNPFLDSLCNFGFKNIGLTPAIPKVCFQHPQDIVIYDWSAHQMVPWILFSRILNFFHQICCLFWNPQNCVSCLRNKMCNKISKWPFEFFKLAICLWTKLVCPNTLGVPELISTMA